MEKYLQIGKIVNTRGIKGEIKVIPLTDDPRRYDDIDWVFIDLNGQLQKYYIQEVRYMNSLVCLRLEDIDSIEAAEKLKDSYILVDRENAVKLPENTWFICDIIGCSVFSDDGSLIGEVTDVLQTGSNDVYVVKRKNKKDALIPALKSLVKDVSIELRKIVVSLPEGLIDD